MKKATALLLLMLFSAQSFATCLVAVMVDNFAYLGADSKGFSPDGNNEEITKVRIVNNYSFAIIGKQFSTSGYNPNLYIENFLKNTKIFTKEIRENLKKTLAQKILSEFKLAIKNPVEKEKMGNIFFGCTIVGFDGNQRPFVYQFQTITKELYNGVAQYEDTFAISNMAKKHQTFLMGANKEIRAATAKHPTLNSKNPIEFIVKAIELEIAAYPAVVGKPILIAAGEKGKFEMLKP